VDLYHQHILIFTGDTPWPPRVEDKVNGIPIVRKTMQIIKDRQKLGLNGDVIFKVGAIEGHYSKDAKAQREGVFEVLLFPSALRFEATEDDMEDLVESFLCFSTPYQHLAPPPDGRIAGEPLNEDTHLFVCAHESRDAKCGDIGRVLADKLQSCLSDDLKEEVRVYRCSHLGGHKFAGNLLVYPQGDWYGNLRAEDGLNIVTEILSGQDSLKSPLLSRHWRGRLGHNKDEQVYLFDQNHSKQ